MYALQQMRAGGVKGDVRLLAHAEDAPVDGAVIGDLDEPIKQLSSTLQGSMPVSAMVMASGRTTISASSPGVLTLSVETAALPAGSWITVAPPPLDTTWPFKKLHSPIKSATNSLTG